MKYMLKLMLLLIFLFFMYPYPTYAAASPSNIEEEIEEEEIEAIQADEEIKTNQFNALLYRLDLLVALLSMLFGCLCASIFSTFWKIRG